MEGDQSLLECGRFHSRSCTSVLASDVAGTKYFCLELIDVVTVGISIVIETVQSLV